jgi:hypothetical protein
MKVFILIRYWIVFCTHSTTILARKYMTNNILCAKYQGLTFGQSKTISPNAITFEHGVPRNPSRSEGEGQI